MEAADALYGVTMQKKGISSLISVRLTEKQVEGEINMALKIFLNLKENLNDQENMQRQQNRNLKNIEVKIENSEIMCTKKWSKI